MTNLEAPPIENFLSKKEKIYIPIEKFLWRGLWLAHERDNSHP